MAKKNGTRGTRLKSKVTATESLFDEVKKNKSPKCNYTIRIDKSIGDKFKELCEKKEVSMSEMIEAFFKKELEQN